MNPVRDRGGARDVAVLVATAGLVAVVTLALVSGLMAQVFVVPSGSMQPLLEVDDRVVAWRLSPEDVERGDVVVFDGAAFEDDSVFVKRVIGLPGDRVYCCADDGAVTVNGVALDEAAYLFPGDDPSRDRFDIQVPAGRLFVMGDHRSASADSRAHLGSPGGGTVPVDAVLGTVVARVWPLGRIGTVR